MINKLLVGLGSVRIVKNCDLGLENAALSGQHFQDLGHGFSVYGLPSRPITYIYVTRKGFHVVSIINS